MIQNMPTKRYFKGSGMGNYRWGTVSPNNWGDRGEGRGGGGEGETALDLGLGLEIEEG